MTLVAPSPFAVLLRNPFEGERVDAAKPFRSIKISKPVPVCPVYQTRTQGLGSSQRVIAVEAHSLIGCTQTATSQAVSFKWRMNTVDAIDCDVSCFTLGCQAGLSEVPCKVALKKSEGALGQRLWG